MWKQCPFIKGDKVYCFQTKDRKINKRMRQRSDFKLSLHGINENIWVYKTTRYSLKEAKKTLSRITRQSIYYDPVYEVFYAKSGVIVAPKNRPQV